MFDIAPAIPSGRTCSTTVQLGYSIFKWNCLKGTQPYLFSSICRPRTAISSLCCYQKTRQVHLLLSLVLWDKPMRAFCHITLKIERESECSMTKDHSLTIPTPGDVYRIHFRLSLQPIASLFDEIFAQTR